ncbi:hypothetical protein [Roseovarius sp.]|uniref:hypothetical protein n=1 Tax=Roseovarius sp. TaxID=1486281 RepID=UPI00260A503F|nr:hypothetical protein [Roseovarius sp.]MDM8165028.1 hypothetical protein [Roseovarius sp.]
MKPNFALTLSFDGISLLHRTHAGWHLVGEVALNAENLAADLAELTAKARMLDPTGLRTKLVLPDDQIKYLALESSARDVNTIEAEVRAALDGATPYPLKELSYDWSVRDGRVHVAAVARETLAEAEAFAQEHSLNPLCFVAMPADDAFAGEPFFGETAYAGKVLGPDESVDRENEVIRIVGAARLPEPAPVPASPAPADDTDAQPPADPEAGPKADAKPEAGAKPQAEPAPQPGPESKPKPKAKQRPGASPDTDAEAEAEARRERQARKKAKGNKARQKDSQPEANAPETPANAKPANSKPANEKPGRANRANDKPAAEKPARDKPADKGSAPADAGPKTAPTFAFTSIRTAPRDGSGETPQPGRISPLPSARFTPPPVSGIRNPPPPADQPQARQKPAEKAPEMQAAELAASLAAVPAPEPENEFAPRTKDDDYTGPPPASITPEVSGKKRKSGIGGFLSRRQAPEGLPADKPRAKGRQPAPGPLHSETSIASATDPQPTAAARSLDEKDRMTIFGARRSESVQPEKPRYMALILTAILLLILVGVAAWAALFLDNGVAGLFRSGDPVETVEQAEPDTDTIDEAVSAALTEQPAAEDGTADPDTETAALSDGDPDLPGNPDAELEVLEEPPPTPRPELVPEELTPDEARARYAATGIWQMAPEPSQAPGVTTLEDVYQTNLDPEVNFSDAVALPEAEDLATGARPVTPSDPPPPGVRYQLDARGFIAATSEGAETPEGAIVFSGPPPIIPPDTPPRASAEVVDGPAAAAPDNPTIRPRARPGDLQETRERSILGGMTRTELAGFRPRPRPKSAQQEAVEALAQETGIDPDSADPMATATEQAVAASLKPQNRPTGFETIIADARKAAAAAREAAASEPVSREQRVAVNIPTATSVARAATERKQISLRKLNLIGVYGKANSRRALVRMANGSYQKVQVGDRLDGGQVAAIGESELRYVKGGRSVVLKMPQG